MKSRIYIIGCGGTIAGRAGAADELLGYQAGEVSVAELIASVPALAEYASIAGEQYCNIDSSSMTEELLTGLSARIQAVADRDDVDGIVVTHGTDSMDETAYFLNLTVHTHKPIVIVGAMRPATAISADGPLNLLEAVRLAACPEAGDYGVLQLMNSSICAARYVEKQIRPMSTLFLMASWGMWALCRTVSPFFIKSLYVSTRIHLNGRARLGNACRQSGSSIAISA